MSMMDRAHPVRRADDKGKHLEQKEDCLSETLIQNTNTKFSPLTTRAPEFDHIWRNVILIEMNVNTNGKFFRSAGFIQLTPGKSLGRNIKHIHPPIDEPNTVTSRG